MCRLEFPLTLTLLDFPLSLSARRRKCHWASQRLENVAFSRDFRHDPRIHSCGFWNLKTDSRLTDFQVQGLQRPSVGF